MGGLVSHSAGGGAGISTFGGDEYAAIAEAMQERREKHIHLAFIALTRGVGDSADRLAERQSLSFTCKILTYHRMDVLFAVYAIILCRFLTVSARFLACYRLFRP